MFKSWDANVLFQRMLLPASIIILVDQAIKMEIKERIKIWELLNTDQRSFLIPIDVRWIDFVESKYILAANRSKEDHVAFLSILRGQIAKDMIVLNPEIERFIYFSGMSLNAEHIQATEKEPTTIILRIERHQLLRQRAIADFAYSLRQYSLLFRKEKHIEPRLC